MPGRTPYRGIRYPLEQELADPVALQNFAVDINSTLAATQLAARYAGHRSSIACWNNPSTSVAKNTLTTINLVPILGTDNGASGPGASPYWSNANPSRITAPATGLYLAWGLAFAQHGASSTTNWTLASVAKNGANPQTSRASQRGNVVPQAAFFFAWPLVAGDFLTMAVQWNGVAAGPLSCDVNISVAMIALP